ERADRRRQALPQRAVHRPVPHDHERAARRCRRRREGSRAHARDLGRGLTYDGGVKLLVAALLVTACKPAAPAKPPASATSTSPDECTTGQTKQTPTTDCTCIHAAPHSAVRPPDDDVHDHWSCTDYGEPSCFGAVQGKACTTDGQKCT